MLKSKLNKIWDNSEEPFFINEKLSLKYNDLDLVLIDGIDEPKSGDVVAIIGDFNHESIATLISLLEKKCILVPLTNETKDQHEYFFEQSKTQYIFINNKLVRTISKEKFNHFLLNNLREKNHPGIILFTTGTTGKPKAILHDFIPFILRYETPRPPLKALSFLLFDHIGGINTLFHMLFNKGLIVSIKDRTVDTVLSACNKFSIELLPTTPTFLRLLSLCPDLKKRIPSSLKIISYGTERMDKSTLEFLCKNLPNVDFRQTYGMSELGILRIKSFRRDSLYMKVAGEGVETKIVEKILFIKAKNKMMGYLNSNNPFDEEGWYCTKDIVEVKENGYLKIIGRDSDVINVGGLKFLPSDVERVCLNFNGVKYAKVFGKSNPFTGMHVELNIELINKNKFDMILFSKFLKSSLPKHMIPLKIRICKIKISHRLKQL